MLSITVWQFFDDLCRFCHLWHKNTMRSVSAMVIIILLAVLALAGVVSTVIELRRDGFRPVATDWTRVAERDIIQNAESAPIYR